jgi:membrane protein DedA with SNARE-associated domain
MAGDLTGDIFWYFVGRLGGRPLIEKYGHFVDLDEENVERAQDFFQDHQVKILFISKITMGFGFALATLVAAGMAKVPFKKYFMINLIGQFIWTGILIGAGYFLGNFYDWVDKSLRWAFIISLIVIAGLVIFGFGKFMRRQVSARIKK